MDGKATEWPRLTSGIRDERGMTPGGNVTHQIQRLVKERSILPRQDPTSYKIVTVSNMLHIIKVCNGCRDTLLEVGISVYPCIISCNEIRFEGSDSSCHVTVHDPRLGQSDVDE